MREFKSQVYRKLILIIATSFLAFSCSKVSFSPNNEPDKNNHFSKAGDSFGLICENADATDDQQKFIDILKEKFEKEDCFELKNILSSSIALDLSFKDIVDISPLKYFPHFQYLNLNYNKITDISILSKFANLKELKIAENPIFDLSNLKNLKNLEVLDLVGISLENIGVKNKNQCPIDGTSEVLKNWCLALLANHIPAESLPTLKWENPKAIGETKIEFSKLESFKNIEFDLVGKFNSLTFKSEYSGIFFWRAKFGVEDYSIPKKINLVKYAADDDEDGLQNGWEMNGINGIDLPKMGANYLRKNIFVEMGYMQEIYLPNTNSMNLIIRTFKESPVNNPDGSLGIDLHLIKGQKVDFDDDLNPYRDEFYKLKQKFFNKAKANIFHYMIWAHKYSGSGSSGVSMGIPGKDFLVSIGSWGSRNTEGAKIGTFLHELGHNLGLKHGGSDHKNYKPNYISIMNYHYQINGIFKDGKRIYDYQRINTIFLVEENLDEGSGIGKEAFKGNYGLIYYCDSDKKIVEIITTKGIDWDCNNIIESHSESDVDNNGKLETISAQQNWRNLDLPGGLKKSFILPPSEDNFLEKELTLEVQLQIDRTYKDHNLKLQ